jgi:hypothetical protein
MGQSQEWRKREIRSPLDSEDEECQSVLDVSAIVARQRQRSAADKEVSEEEEISAKEEAEAAEAISADEYDELLDEITDMLEDEEMAEHYVQLGGE